MKNENQERQIHARSVQDDDEHPVVHLSIYTNISYNFQND